MIDIKVSLTIVVPEATMLSTQECVKQLKKPVISKRTGKQVRDRKGNLVWKYEEVPDLDKLDRHDIKISTINSQEVEVISFYTRKSKPARQVLNISREAYKSFISNEMPPNYHAPKSFVPYMPTRSRNDRKLGKWVDGMPINIQAWKQLSTEERLKWHLENIAQNFNGRVESYSVFND